ncbi:MAG TPA: hypothetical protein VNN76_03930 [Bacteroidota bacterium]|nr:hypothetical protein [Bacteroidota bacterium]
MRYGIPAVAAIVMVATVSQFACKDKSVDPPIKNPREYTWRADTIEFPDYPPQFQILLSTIWGSSSTNVYATGFTSFGAIMFRFDGQRWDQVFFPDPPTFGQSWYDNNHMLGFAPNNIYVVGAEWYRNPTPPPYALDSSSVLHFDGNQWRPVQLPERSGWVLKIWADSPTNIYIGGKDAIWHFNGVAWKKYPIPINDAGNRIGVTGLTGNQSGTVYISYETHEPAFARTRHYFLSFRNSQWTKLDSAVVESGNIQKKWGYAAFWTSPSGTMYSVDAEVWRWNGSSWSVINPSVGAALSSITGTSDSNIFVTGHFGTFLHYNGQDWFRYENIRYTNVTYVRSWKDGKEVFLVGWIGNNTILLHGK